MIRVLHILSTITGGGVERRRLSLVKYLDKKLFELKIIGTYKSGFIADQIEANGVEVIEIGKFSGPFHWEKHKLVQQIIQDFKPHIIHGAVYEGVTLAAVNGFLKKVPIVILEETSDPQNRSLKASFLLRVFSLFAKKVVAISPNTAIYLKKTVKVSPDKIIIINNGVEYPRPVSLVELSKLKNKFKIADSDIIVGSVGRLYNEVKRYTDLIEAISLIRNKNLKLLIIGGGPDENLIRKTCQSFNIEDRVIFTGYQFDTAPYYRLMDVFCITSKREGFGLVTVEAMLHYLPVIATEVGGLIDIVINGETGFLIPPMSPHEIANKIEILIANLDLRKSMGIMGRLRAIEHYSADRYCKDVQTLYLKMLYNENIDFTFPQNESS